MNNLSWINNKFDSYQQLITFYQRHKEEMFGDIHLSLNNFFAANMSAALGAILDQFKENISDIHFEFIDPTIEAILQKNDFLSYYGKSRAADTNRTTIKYQKLKPTDGKYFKNYVINELIDGHINDLPKMSSGAKEK